MMGRSLLFSSVLLCSVIFLCLPVTFRVQAQLRPLPRVVARFLGLLENDRMALNPCGNYVRVSTPARKNAMGGIYCGFPILSHSPVKAERQEGGCGMKAQNGGGRSKGGVQ